MPSRTAMVLASNGRNSLGDPFLGTLVRGAFAVGKGILRATGVIGRKTTAIARRVPAAIAKRPVLTRIARTGAAAAGAGVAFEAGTRLIGTDAAGNPVFARKRRRRGLSATEIRGFKRTVSLLSSLGMTPRSPKKRGHGHVVLSK